MGVYVAVWGWWLLGGRRRAGSRAWLGARGAGVGVKSGGLGGWELVEPVGEVAAGASSPVDEGGDDPPVLVADEVELLSSAAVCVGSPVGEPGFEVVVERFDVFSESV